MRMSFAGCGIHYSKGMWSAGMGRKVRVVLLAALVCLGGVFWLEQQEIERDRFWAANANGVGIEDEEAYRELKQIALTFDDGPDAVWTERLLDGLQERGVKATFFVIGEKIEGNEELLRRMYEEGHLIGNHSYHHVELNRLRESTVLEEIERTNALIYEATGYRPEFIRPPYGSWNRKTDCPGEMISVYWTVDTLDWQSQDEDSVVDKILTQAKDGDIILLHDIFESSVEGALEAIDRLMEAGYELVTVDQLMFDS